MQDAFLSKLSICNLRRKVISSQRLPVLLVSSFWLARILVLQWAKQRQLVSPSTRKLLEWLLSLPIILSHLSVAKRTCRVLRSQFPMIQAVDRSRTHPAFYQLKMTMSSSYSQLRDEGNVNERGECHRTCKKLCLLLQQIRIFPALARGKPRRIIETPLPTI